MSRYIDADALKETIDKEIFRHDTIDHVFQIIDDAPSIDIVRCRECKHYDTPECQIKVSLYGLNADDFCSYGDKRDD